MSTQQMYLMDFQNKIISCSFLFQVNYILAVLLKCTSSYLLGIQWAEHSVYNAVLVMSRIKYAKGYEATPPRFLS
jgi:hypothetical protein